MPVCKFIVLTVYVFALPYPFWLTTFGTFWVHTKCDTLRESQMFLTVNERISVIISISKLWIATSKLLDHDK
jgi:hypothetical protein